MRHLLYVTLGFGLACALLAYQTGLHIALFSGVMLLLLCLFWRRTGHPVKVALCVLFGCAVGWFWFGKYQGLYLQDAAALDGVSQSAEIRITDYSEETDYGMRAYGRVFVGGKPYRLVVYLDDGEPLAPADRVSGTFRFRVTTAGGSGESDYHQGLGIFLMAYQDSDLLVWQAPAENRDIPAILRHKIKGVIWRCFPEDTAPFAQALLVGDTSDLSYGVDTTLKVSGIRHVVAVSGLHISILFGLFSTLTLKRRWLTALVGFPGLFLFAAIAGFSPSVSRAGIMCGLMLLAMLTNREYDGPTALSFAVLVLLVCNPLSVTSVSLQLSAGSMAGIYLFEKEIREYLSTRLGERTGPLEALKKQFCASVSVTLSTMTVTTPLCAYYFGMVSLVSPVTNLLTLWVVGFLFYGILAVGGLYLIAPAAAAFLAKLLSVPIRYVLLVARAMASLPLAAVYTDSPYIVAWLVFVYVLLVVFLIGKNRKAVALGCCAVLGLCMALMAAWLEPMGDDVRLTVLDVGQGQCLVMQSEGRTFLVDCGGDSDSEAADRAAEYLLSRGIPKLDGVIVTHLDRDHAGGVANLLSRVNTELLILPEIRSELGSCTQGETIYASQTLELTMEKTQITVYPPTFPGNSNEMSLCILFDTEKCDILITGDRNGFGERALLRNAQIPEVDILIAGHHGSRHSTCEELLTAVRPKIVCISVGRDNSYGHPSPDLLKRLERFGCQVVRTDQLGTYTIRR